MEFKTKPRAHQLKAYELSKDAKVFALFMEQGTGKTKVELDTTAYLYDKQAIDALLVLAPNGVHRNWVTEEIPTHLPDLCRARSYVWRSDRAKNKAHLFEQSALLAHNCLSVLSVNIESLTTETTRAYLRQFFKARKVKIVVDESTTIKTPGAKRTKLTIAAGKLAKVRRVLTGTPVTQGPLDLYSQIGFLDPAIFGFTSFYAFKHHYAEWKKGYGNGREYEELVGYINLEELKERLAPHSFRVTKDECLDLPPKIYQKHFFQLGPELRAFYNKLRDEMVAALAHDQQFTVAHVLTRMLRLQQASSNYWSEQNVMEVHGPCAGEGCAECQELGVIESRTPAKRIAKANDRLNAFRDLLPNLPRPVIVWAKFKHEITDLYNLLKPDYRVATYTGSTSTDERAKSVKDFQNGDLDFWLGNPRAGGRGLTLTRAQSMVNYSHDYSLEVRLQSEDRPHRIGLDHSLLIVDMIAEDTVDEPTVEALRNKRSIANLITGDRTMPWL